MRKNVYSNGIEYKLKNKRVAVIKDNDGRFIIQSKILGVGSPVSSEVVRDKITVSSMVISEESMYCIMDAINELLKKNIK